MSQGEAKKSASCVFFGTKKASPSGNEQARKRTLLEVNDAAVATTSNNINSQQTFVTMNDNSEADTLAIKLNRLTEKCYRYISHKQFLTKCKAEGQIPTGLQLTLEPSIGNQDEQFLKEWYDKLDECSTFFIDMVIEYCNKTIIMLEEQKSTTKEELNRSLQKDDYVELISIIDSN